MYVPKCFHEQVRKEYLIKRLKEMYKKDNNETQAEQLPQDAVMQSVLDAKELRIGNCVLDIDNDVLSVSEITKDYVSFNNCNLKSRYSKIKPIPLTEEWLIKLGFINDRVLEFYRNDITDSTIIIDYNFICLLGYSHVKLNYVHELQNLYFALTGRELTVA